MILVLQGGICIIWWTVDGSERGGADFNIAYIQGRLGSVSLYEESLELRRVATR